MASRSSKRAKTVDASGNEQPEKEIPGTSPASPDAGISIASASAATTDAGISIASTSAATTDSGNTDNFDTEVDNGDGVNAGKILKEWRAEYQKIVNNLANAPETVFLQEILSNPEATKVFCTAMRSFAITMPMIETFCEADGAEVMKSIDRAFTDQFRTYGKKIYSIIKGGTVDDAPSYPRPNINMRSASVYAAFACKTRWDNFISVMVHCQSNPYYRIFATALDFKMITLAKSVNKAVALMEEWDYTDNAYKYKCPKILDEINNLLFQIGSIFANAQK